MIEQGEHSIGAGHNLAYLAYEVPGALGVAMFLWPPYFVQDVPVGFVWATVLLAPYMAYLGLFLLPLTQWEAEEPAGFPPVAKA